MDERRRSPRHRIFKSGTISFNRAGVVSCTVRNLSATGACLEVESPVGIPETFELMIGDASPAQHCKVAWRSVSRIGVAFTGP
jgi:PilZ domain